MYCLGPNFTTAYRITLVGSFCSSVFHPSWASCLFFLIFLDSQSVKWCLDQGRLKKNNFLEANRAWRFICCLAWLDLLVVVVVAAVGDQAQIPLPTRLFLLLSSYEIICSVARLGVLRNVSEICKGYGLITGVQSLSAHGFSAEMVVITLIESEDSTSLATGNLSSGLCHLYGN